MHITKEEALSLLRKWQNEKPLLQCVMYDRIPDTQHATIGLMGFVEQVDAKSLCIDAKGVDRQYGKYFSCNVDLEGALYQFEELRNSPDESLKLVYESALVILLPESGAFCEILVTRPKTEIVDIVLGKQR